MLLHKFVSTVQISLILLLMPLKRLKTVKKVPMAKMLLSLKSSETKVMIVMILLSLKAEKKLMMNPLSLKIIQSALDQLVLAAVQLFKKILKAQETKVSKVQLFLPKTLLSETKAQMTVKMKLLRLKAETTLMMNPKTIQSVLDQLVLAAVQLFKKILKALETMVSKVQLFVPKTPLLETKAQKKVKAKKALMMSPLRLAVAALASEQEQTIAHLSILKQLTSMLVSKAQLFVQKTLLSETETKVLITKIPHRLSNEKNVNNMVRIVATNKLNYAKTCTLAKMTAATLTPQQVRHLLINFKLLHKLESSFHVNLNKPYSNVF